MADVAIAFLAVVVMVFLGIVGSWWAEAGQRDEKDSKHSQPPKHRRHRRHRSKRWRHTDRIDEPSSTEDLAGATAFSVKGTTIALSPLLIVLAVCALIFLALLCAKDLNAFPSILTHFPFPF